MAAGATQRRLGLLTAFVLALSACSAPGASSPASPPSTAAASTPAESPSEEIVPFGVATVAPGFSQAPMLAAIDALKAQGYTVNLVEIASADLSPTGVINGTDFQFSAGSGSGVFNAMKQGAPMKFIASRIMNEWTLYARSDIATCADLDGKRLAIHAEGSLSTGMVRAWIRENCPGTEPEYLIIDGSPNRYAALLAGQIDASPLELVDAIRLEQEAPGSYHLMVNFAEAIPTLQPTLWYGNTEFMAAHPATVQLFLKAMLEEHRKIAEDPAYLKQLVLTYDLGEDDALLDQVVQRYSELGIFPTDGGLTAEAVDATLQFFGETELTADVASDLSYLEAVLDQIGRD